MISQWRTLSWKQMLNLRADWPSLLAILLLPSVLEFLSSTNSGSITTAAGSTKLIECKIDNFLYCNYPMRINVEPDFAEDFNNDVHSSFSTFQMAASNVAIALGSDSDRMFFQGDDTGSTSKDGGEVKISSLEKASATWFHQENSAFTESFVNLFNQELDALGSDIRFEEAENPYAFEGKSAFDLRIGSFLPLLNTIGNDITNEKSSNMFFYLTRIGLLSSAFWTFQYIYWMIVSSATIGITALTAFVLDRDFDYAAYFVAAWWHISFAVFLGIIFKDKKYINLISIALLMRVLPFSSFLHWHSRKLKRPMIFLISSSASQSSSWLVPSLRFRLKLDPLYLLH